MFRLETRESYNERDETEELRAFLAGRPQRPDPADAWYALVGKAKAEGRPFRRVRVVDVPLSDYSRFGVWGAQFNNEAGEDIRYLTRERANELALPDHDFWLFDSRLLAWMHFDPDDGRLLSIELVEDPSVIVAHNHWRDVARHHAIRRDDFAAQHQQSDDEHRRGS